MVYSPDDSVVNIDQMKSFIPSYEKQIHNDYLEPPSVAQRFAENVVTAAVWTGVLLTFPVSYFYVRKTPEKDRQILISRLGRLQKSASAGSFYKLPMIDSEIEIDLSQQTYYVRQKEIFTTDKCGVVVSCELKWRLVDPVQAHSTSSDYKKLAEDEFALEVNRQISKSYIRQLAMEKAKIEDNIRFHISVKVDKIGIKIDSVFLEFVPSKNQPFISPDIAAAPEPLGGIGGAIESANNGPGMGIFNDMLEGLTDHPGFSQIISSVIQTVGDVHRSNLEIEEIEETEEFKLSIREIIDILKSKKLVVKEKSILIKLEEGNIFIREDIIKEHSNEFKDQKADCFLTMKATVLVKILQEKLSYKTAFSNGQLAVDGDVNVLSQLLAFM